MTNRPLSIAVDARPLAFPHNGIGRYTTNLLREFASQQLPYSIHLYSDRPFAPTFPLPKHWKVRIGKVSSGGLSTAFAQLVFPFWAVKDRVEIFWSPRHQLPLLLPPYIRKVLTIHDVVWRRFPQTMRRGGPAVEAMLTPFSLRVADAVIADSQFTCSELAVLFPWVASKVRVVYLASSLSRDASTDFSPHSHPYFLFVGSSEPRKNLRGLLNAYKQYRLRSSSPFDLIVAGSDQWGEFSVTDYIRANDLESSVRVIKHVDDTLLCALYAHAQALVMVSFYEGFGLPLVEAMQWGIPLIASSASALAEIAGNAALLVDPNDSDAIARALDLITDDPKTRMTLASHAQTRGLQFSWEKAASETMALIVGDPLVRKSGGSGEIIS
jgi:glycosyltransferase involved in cell wall biosynthesis